MERASAGTSYHVVAATTCYAWGQKGAGVSSRPPGTLLHGVSRQASSPRLAAPRPEVFPQLVNATSPPSQRNRPLKPHPHSKYRISKVSSGNSSAVRLMTGFGGDQAV